MTCLIFDFVDLDLKSHNNKTYMFLDVPTMKHIPIALKKETQSKAKVKVARCDRYSIMVRRFRVLTSERILT